MTAPTAIQIPGFRGDLITPTTMTTATPERFGTARSTDDPD
jgi:hypothetical protein